MFPATIAASAPAELPGAITALLVMSSLDVPSVNVSAAGRRIAGVKGKLDGVIRAVPPEPTVSDATLRVLVLVVVFPPKFTVPLAVRLDAAGIEPLTFSVAVGAAV